MAIMRYSGYNLTGERGELPESVRAAAGSWNLFPLLGVQPALGRAFTEAEDQRGSTVVMLTLERVPEAVCRRREYRGPPDSSRRQAAHGSRRAAFVVHLSRCRHPVVGAVSSRMPRRSSCSITTGTRAR